MTYCHVFFALIGLIILVISLGAMRITNWVRDVHGNGTFGIPWDSHGNGSDNDYRPTMGMGLGVGIKVWEWEYSYGDGNEFPLQLFVESYEILFSNT